MSTTVKSAVENLSDTLVKLTVEVPFDELKPSMDAAYKKVGQQVRIPGFRPARCRQRVLDQRVGRAVVLEEAINDAIPRLLRRRRTRERAAAAGPALASR